MILPVQRSLIEDLATALYVKTTTETDCFVLTAI